MREGEYEKLNDALYIWVRQQVEALSQNTSILLSLQEIAAKKAKTKNDLVLPENMIPIL